MITCSFSFLSRTGLWPEGGGHLVEVICHHQRLRLLREQVGKPTSDVRSTVQGALSCNRTIRGTLLIHTRCINLALNLDLQVRSATSRGGPGSYMGFPVLVASWLGLWVLKLVKG